MPISYKVVDLFLWQEEIQIQHPSIPRNFPSFCGQATAVGLDLNRGPLRVAIIRNKRCIPGKTDCGWEFRITKSRVKLVHESSPVVYELRTVRQAARADLGMSWLSQRNQTVCYETVQLRPKMGVC